MPNELLGRNATTIEQLPASGQIQHIREIIGYQQRTIAGSRWITSRGNGDRKQPFAHAMTFVEKTLDILPSIGRDSHRELSASRRFIILNQIQFSGQTGVTPSLNALSPGKCAIARWGSPPANLYDVLNRQFFCLRMFLLPPHLSAQLAT